MKLLFPTKILLEIQDRGLGRIAPKGSRWWIDKINVVGERKSASGVMLHAYELGKGGTWLDSNWFKDVPHINR